MWYKSSCVVVTNCSYPYTIHRLECGVRKSKVLIWCLVYEIRWVWTGQTSCADLWSITAGASDTSQIAVSAAGRPEIPRYCSTDNDSGIPVQSTSNRRLELYKTRVPRHRITGRTCCCGQRCVLVYSVQVDLLQLSEAVFRSIHSDCPLLQARGSAASASTRRESLCCPVGGQWPTEISWGTCGFPDCRGVVWAMLSEHYCLNDVVRALLSERCCLGR